VFVPEDPAVSFADYHEEIQQPTEEQKAAVLLKPKLELSTEDYAREYFDEVQLNKPPSPPVQNDLSSSAEISKKKTAKGFLKGAYDSACLLQLSRDSHGPCRYLESNYAQERQRQR
jgi:hypothetical protein